jgi:hypothetical protein
MTKSKLNLCASRIFGPGVSLRLVAAVVLMCLIYTQQASSTEPDLQLWFPVQLIHQVGEKWAVSMQTEVRLQDDISEFSQLVLKPALNYHFNQTFALSVGYKYIDKYQEKANENDIWQEIHFNRKHNDLVTGLQFRLEERLINDIDGAIARLRLLHHWSHPIGEGPNYLTGSEAVRFNLNSQGEGPVAGFEQSRIYAAVGKHIKDNLQFEVGYLWRYEEERLGDNASDHAIHFQLVYNTRSKRIKKPTSRDRYR